MFVPLSLFAKSVGLRGPAPLGPVEVPLTPGVVALYGRNGAGKSRLLSSLKDVLGGGKPGWVTVNVDPDELADRLVAAQERWREDREAEPVAPLKDAPWHGAGRSSLDRAMGDLLAERWVLAGSSLPGQGRSERLVEPRVLVDEVVRNHEVVLHLAEGEAPRLELYVNIGLSTPGLRTLIADFGRRLDEFRTATARLDPVDGNSPEYEELLDHWVDWLASFHSSDFFTVFGPLPNSAMEQWWNGSLYWTPSEMYRFLSDYEWLVAPSTRQVCLTSDLVGSLIGEVLWSASIAMTDDQLVGTDGLGATTTEAFTTWGSFEATRLDPEPGPDEMVRRKRLEFVKGATSPQVADWVVELAAHLSVEATRLFQDLLPEAPMLECRVGSIDEWFAGDAVRWTAVDPTGALVSISDLSLAQARLATLAITLVVTAFNSDFDDRLLAIETQGLFGDDSAVDDIAGTGTAATRFAVRWPSGRRAGRGPTVIVLDEPEAGLHVAAEDQLVSALRDYGVRHDVTIVMATHSRAALKNRDITLVEVYRGKRGATATRVVEFPQDFSAEALGVDRADLLQLIDAVLLVEGHHELVILEELLGDELKRRRVKVVAMRGTNNLTHVADLEFIADTLDVPVLVMLDNLRADAMDALWQDLLVLPTQDRSGPIADELVTKHFGSKRSNEESQAASLARALLRRDQPTAMSVFGLKRPDVLDYLPVERLVPGGKSWGELRAEHQKQLASENRVRQFKPWLAAKRRADFGDDAIRIACAELGEPPDELMLLLARLDTIQDGWRS